MQKENWTYDRKVREDSIPEQREGVAVTVEDSVEFGSEAEAHAFFRQWKALVSGLLERDA